jgi:hypothetical protein
VLSHELAIGRNHDIHGYAVYFEPLCGRRILVSVKLHRHKLGLNGGCYAGLIEYVLVKRHARSAARCPEMDKDQTVGLLGNCLCGLQVMVPLD